MNIKKTLSALMVGAMVLSAAPVLPASASFVSTAYAAKGGAKMSIPKSAPAPKAPAPKAPAAGATNNANTSKSVSGNGSSYAPSKDAKSLDKNAPAANAKSNAAAANANTQSSSRLGSIMRGIGIFAGGMLLGSMLSHLFGMGSGMFADILGLLMNGLLIVVAIMAVRWLWNKFRGNKTSASSPRDHRQDLEMRQQPMDSQQMRTPIQDIKPRGNDYEPKSTADRYRNR